ncbi:DUF1214 domain-containing protein [Microbacterium terregens]|uniref:DUF1214 domain-containing protein n=1 Tax=Microbacterium terregens TaxID=69363 RepID=A0ABV5T3W0_9MICO
MSTPVNADNFARAETDRMFRELQDSAGGVNRFLHNRKPAAIDEQTVIRLNRDTLYSFAVVDVRRGATLTLPEHGDRYLSAMVVPVDGFWSISVYNAKGYFEPNEREAHTANNITGVKNADGSTTVRFGDYPRDVPNAIPVTEGWNYLVRLYRPRPEVLDGSWVFPHIAA